MPSTHQLTQRQIRCMEKLPEGHRMVNARHGAPTMRRSDGQLFRVQPNGRLSIQRICRCASWWVLGMPAAQSYLDVHG